MNKEQLIIETIERIQKLSEFDGGIQELLKRAFKIEYTLTLPNRFTGEFQESK